LEACNIKNLELLKENDYETSQRLQTKDAGFVHEYFQNETNRVIWNFCFHETNPQNESFKNESTFLRISYTIPASLLQTKRKWLKENDLETFHI
jgi:hypothetical protein